MVFGLAQWARKIELIAILNVERKIPEARCR
jgi:hypothetical protein